jgi:hypothetical protein
MTLDMSATPESVWALMKENARQLRKMRRSQKEYDRKFQEDKAEHDRMIAEMRAETAELSKNVGGINNSLGDMAEGLMASDLYEHFKALGLDFDHSCQNYVVKDRKTRQNLAEVDMLLLNGTIAMAVEVKTTMTRGDVDDHEKRMDIIRNKPNSLFVNRKLYGAMAAVKTSPAACKYAIKKGFFVIELSGGAVKINMPEGFTPKIW